MNYACAFSQSELGKYFEWTIIIINCTFILKNPFGTNKVQCIYVGSTCEDILFSRESSTGISFNLAFNNLYNTCKRNNLSEQAIRDVPTHEHKLAQIFARLNSLQGGFNKLCNGFGWIHLQHMRMVVAFAAELFHCFWA